MIIYRQVILKYTVVPVYTHKTWVMSVFHQFLKIFLVLIPFLLDLDPYCFCLEPDPYQSSSWFRIHNEFFRILVPDLYQNDTDPPHCMCLIKKMYLRRTISYSLILLLSYSYLKKNHNTI